MGPKMSDGMKTKRGGARDGSGDGSHEPEMDQTDALDEAENAGGASAEDTSPERKAEHEIEQELTSQLDALQSEFGTLNDRHLRLAAEFQNYRRRAESEMSEAWGRAQADLVRRFVDVMDDLQRVSSLEPSSDALKVQSIVEGVDLVERKLAKALQEAGVTVVDPTGARFDPATMEAVLSVPATSPEDDEQVAQVFQKGYMLRGNLIRPARVSVKKHD
jgi:molecular chaperone GrpE